MNYRHAFHAGNHGDVLKHAVLARVVLYMAAKDKSMCALDVHAGAGQYELFGPEALRTGEWQDGIGTLWQAALDKDIAVLLRPYLDVVAGLNPDGRLRRYCGTPDILSRLSRKTDRLIFNELHPTEHAMLRHRYQADSRVRITSVDSVQSVKAELPFAERRGIVVIDPPYEEKGEPAKIARMLRQGLRRMANAVFFIWYPVTTEAFAQEFRENLGPVVPAGSLHLQLRVAEASQGGGLSGSGLIIVNPPWTLHDECKLLLPALAKVLGKSHWGASRVELLTPRTV